jgi:hypothetical protein
MLVDIKDTHVFERQRVRGIVRSAKISDDWASKKILSLVPCPVPEYYFEV